MYKNQTKYEAKRLKAKHFAITKWKNDNYLGFNREKICFGKKFFFISYLEQRYILYRIS